MTVGKVYLVGAGPGDPGLVTLRAVEVLRQADFVLYDYLVNQAILRHCSNDAVLVSLGKHGSGRVATQAEINDRLLALSQANKSVVRLKSGDPMVFARAAEELDFLVKNRIPFEIVPGVTAGLAAASYAGIPVTHRESASAVALVTGQEDADKADSSLDYAALAQFPGTLVFYMGVTTAEHWSQALIAAGKPANTPVMIVRRVSLPDQRRIETTLGELAAVVRQAKLRPPVVSIVGDVAALGDAQSWFEERPLFGQKVLVTRPREQADALVQPLEALGAEVLLQPAIEILPVAASSAVDHAMLTLDEFDWVVFSSANGVRCFLDRLPSVNRDLRALGKVKIAAIGPGTAEELARYHLTADLIPEEYRAEALAEALAGRNATEGVPCSAEAKEGVPFSAAGKHFLLIRASRGREVLAEELTKAGGHVEQVIVYDSVDVTEPKVEIAERMAAGQIGWTTVTSSAIARSLARMFGDSLQKTKLASISPITSATLRELGFEPAAEAAEYTMPGVIQVIVEKSVATSAAT